MNAPDGRPMIQPTTRSGLRSWLEHNHATSSGVWLAGYKKATGKPRLDYAEVVEEALSFGWIDSKPNSLDDERSLLWISPRNPKSGWSRINKERIARLEREGRLADAGKAAVAVAKRNGAWTALDAVEALEMPSDLEQALRKNRRAAEHFAAFPPSSKKIILTWIAAARRPDTRASRVAHTVSLAARNIRANHYRQPARR